MGVFERGRGPATARKLRAEGSEQGVENSVNMNVPTLQNPNGLGARQPAGTLLGGRNRGPWVSPRPF